MEIILQVVLLMVGFVMLIKGADWFVEGASGIADRFGIPQLVIGLTIVAFGTSAPEAAVSITAAVRGNVGISIGNIVGSNILNILIILGITSVIVTVAVQKSIINIQIPYMIVITVLLLGLGYAGNSISFTDGVILWIAFIIFLAYLIYMSIVGSTKVEESSKNEKVWRLLLATVVGVILVVWGSDVTVDSATKIAEVFGLSERLIGLTIVALGTSLPELITSVLAARRGKADIAIGNIVGSNIFNILFVLGTTALITPIPFASNFLIDTIVAIAAGILLLVCSIRKQRLTRMSGIFMLVCYVAYFMYLIQ